MAETTEGQRKHIEREFEIGKDEAWFANIKRTYDEYQDVDLLRARRSETHFDTTVSNAQSFLDELRATRLQAVQNAVETANMVAKQAVRHGDLAIDRQWNPDEVAQLTTVVAAVLSELGLVKRQGGIDQNPEG